MFHRERALRDAGMVCCSEFEGLPSMAQDVPLRILDEADEALRAWQVIAPEGKSQILLNPALCTGGHQPTLGFQAPR